MKKIYRIIRAVHLPAEAACLFKRAANGYKHIIDLGEKNGVKMIAHRGLSALNRENTVASFKAAAKENYFGIETDVHLTADGKYVIIHDDFTGRVSNVNVPIETSTLDKIQAVRLKPKNGDTSDEGTTIPMLTDYISVCKDGGKIAVLELKNHFDEKYIVEILDIIRGMGYLENMVFISFDWENCLTLRKLGKDFKIQFLSARYDKKLVKHLAEHGFALDVYYRDLTKKRIKYLHDNGVEVNCWTVDNARDAKRLIKNGVDFITTNVLV